MDTVDWGWNLQTLQAAGSIGTTFAALGIIATLFLTMRATQVAQREVASRMRPWLGVSDVKFEASGGTAPSPTDLVIIEYHNVGALPSQNAKIYLRLEPEKSEEPPSTTQDDEPVVLEEPLLGSIFPNEPSKQRFKIQGTRVPSWRQGRRTVLVIGEFQYALDGKRFRTEFEVKLDFTSDANHPDISWHNIRAE